MSARIKRMRTMSVVNTIQVEGIDIPIDETNINALDFDDCNKFRDLIVFRYNYLFDLSKYMTTYDDEKQTLNTLIDLYTFRLKSLKIQKRNELQRSQKQKELQKLQDIKDHYAKTGECKGCGFDHYESHYPFQTCTVCGKQTRNDNSSMW